MATGYAVRGFTIVTSGIEGQSRRALLHSRNTHELCNRSIKVKRTNHYPNFEGSIIEAKVVETTVSFINIEEYIRYGNDW